VTMTSCVTGAPSGGSDEALGGSNLLDLHGEYAYAPKSAVR
jgi:hypothetical protein